MIEYVTKRDGSKQAFDPDKLNKWAEYTTKHNVPWSFLAQETYKRLTNGIKTEEIQRIMISVCLSQETLEWSRVAARLEYALLRANMKKHLGMDDRADFKELYEVMQRTGYYKGLPPFHPKFEEWYQELTKVYLEYWQVKQWSDKYALRADVNTPIETPHMGILALSIALFKYNDEAFEYAKAVIKGKINLPTPVINGCRNGDFNTISCCVISADDTIDSIGVAQHLAYTFTARKAGIGIEFTTRSKGEDVKNGVTKHLGKSTIYSTLDKAVKMFTQVTRGGNATVSFTCIDPEILELLQLKSQRTPENKRIDKLDYSFVYSDLFMEAVIKDDDWYLYSYKDTPEAYDAFYWGLNTNAYKEFAVATVKAREILKVFLTTRYETGRIYCTNIDRMNTHTPFLDEIRLSNLCQEIAIPTESYVNMEELYNNDLDTNGEVGFCTLGAINVMNIESDAEYERLAELVLLGLEVLLDKSELLTDKMTRQLQERRSVGVGITGLAGYLYKQGLDYDGSAESLTAVHQLVEKHYYYLLKASQKLAVTYGSVGGIDEDWLPIDTAVRYHKIPLVQDWEALRGKPRRHSVLVAHMPTESSALFSNATNGVYPVRQKVIYKSSRKGMVQFIAPDGNYKLAWDINNTTLYEYYSIIQDFTDQGLSADEYNNPKEYPGGKVPLSILMKNFVKQHKLGLKTLYYVNTDDTNGGIFNKNETEEEACESCKI